MSVVPHQYQAQEHTMLYMYTFVLSEKELEPKTKKKGAKRAGARTTIPLVYQPRCPPSIPSD